MKQKQHWGIFIDNQSHKNSFVKILLGNEPHSYIESLKGLKGGLFSKLAVDYFIEEEARHDQKLLSAHTSQSLESMSSGERKKVLLAHLLKKKLDFLILDNPFDNLDRAARLKISDQLQKRSSSLQMVQLISRIEDTLPFITQFARLNKSELELYDSFPSIADGTGSPHFQTMIPPPLERVEYQAATLLRLNNVSIAYSGKPVLNKINWEVKPNEFWQLTGPNGSGKSTILSMITGDNPKAYGQDIWLFGTKKGSGESVWDIKEKIGYFTPAMLDRFRGYHSVENMLISGLTDSIGLYVQPSKAQKEIAKKWLELLNMTDQKDTLFQELSQGQRRLVMCARAMVKHPLLLILDEPTAGLDDKSAALVVALVNKMAMESRTAIIFVSHRKEKGLEPQFNYNLKPSEGGSIGFSEKNSSQQKKATQ